MELHSDFWVGVRSNFSSSATVIDISNVVFIALLIQSLRTLCIFGDFLVVPLHLGEFHKPVYQRITVNNIKVT